MFVFTVPLLTMKIFAEEKRSGTIEFLVTSPIKNTDIVVGKFLGSLTFYTIILAITGVYYALIEYFGAPDRWPILTGYLGIWLEGMLFIAMGMLTSSWTKNQIVAALSSYAMILLLYFSVTFAKYLSPQAQAIIKRIGFLSHLENFYTGLITLDGIIYYASGVFFCLFLTTL